MFWWSFHRAQEAVYGDYGIWQENFNMQRREKLLRATGPKWSAMQQEEKQLATEGSWRNSSKTLKVTGEFSSDFSSRCR
jgi:hypothetical protein